MKRFVIFGLIGPLVGFLVLIALGGGFRSNFWEAFFIALPFAMVAGLAPALVTAAFDHVFQMRGISPWDRYILTGIVGYGAAYLLMLVNLFEPTPLVPFQYNWGLIGAFPAIVCSWLSNLRGALPPPG